MANQNLVDVFNVKKRTVEIPNVTDYEVFPDKEKLDELRTKIIQNLIDNTIPKNLSLEQYINDEIDETLQDYDLEPLERNHIFNLIQNEINGYGPLTDLLENELNEEFETSQYVVKQIINEAGFNKWKLVSKPFPYVSHKIVNKMKTPPLGIPPSKNESPNEAKKIHITSAKAMFKLE